MALRPTIVGRFPRDRLVRVLAGFLLASALATMPAAAQLLPQGFFDMQISPGQGAAAVEADRLSYDARNDVISADGGVIFDYQGFSIRADRLQYNQRTGELLALGNVVMRDPGGNVYEAERVEVTGQMKEAFIESLTVTTPSGARVTARDIRYADTLTTILTEASYSPCGLCIDSKGRRIGWTVRAARMIYDRERASVTLEQPSLELLGIPVAWLPWFWAPDPTQPRATGLRMPSLGYSHQRGAELAVPWFIPAGDDIDIVFTPTLMSRQGVLARGELTWRLPELEGEIRVAASGVYQLDPSAFAGTVGDRAWRGAIQTSGRFTPVEDWTVGWSYAAFTDNAYLPDYDLDDGDVGTNQLYATHLTASSWIDARIQRFNRLGNYNATDDEQQGLNLPRVDFDHLAELAPGWGQARIAGTLLGIHRGLDQTNSYNGVDHDFGYAGTKTHAMVEGSWENQTILAGGLAATPYLGLRLDAAWYDGSSSDPGAPPASTLLSATPIAALDLRYPLIGFNGDDAHLFEPIGQLVWRGSGTTAVGITNDDAHSFVFDTSNLFSYNRFSGVDRQETGLRANIGGHYLGSFADGSWLDVVAGQSFHLAGVNALGVSDAAQVGTATGLGDTASFIVASARGGLSGGLEAGAKVQIDPSAWRITRAGGGIRYAPPAWFSLGVEYAYVAAQPALGITDDQHEVATRASVPVADYWTLSGGLTWDVENMTWLKADTGIGYDDGYLELGGRLNFEPGSWGFGIDFRLKGPDGGFAF